jgi:hypothetical protein
MTNVEHAEGGTVVQPDEAGIIFSAKASFDYLCQDIVKMNSSPNIL